MTITRGYLDTPVIHINHYDYDHVVHDYYDHVGHGDCDHVDYSFCDHMNHDDFHCAADCAYVNHDYWLMMMWVMIIVIWFMRIVIMWIMMILIMISM